MTTRLTPAQLSKGSVIQEPAYLVQPGVGPVSSDLVISLDRTAAFADTLPEWGVDPVKRDRELRKFWKSEPFLASVMFSTCAKYATFPWYMRGKPRMANIAKQVMDAAQFGQGYTRWALKFLQDVFSQDNGAIIELVRIEDDWRSPCIGFNHLDSERCRRTGQRDYPILYKDLKGTWHRMAWYQVIPFVEFPSPMETAYDAQFCAVSRILRAAQIMRDIATYKREKISGRFVRAIHLVGGVSATTVKDVMEQKRTEADNEHFTRYIEPVIVASVDPNATVSAATIEMASLPDGFDEETAFRWYVVNLANAFGLDPQDIAPLPGGNLGSAQQSETLHLKGTTKGPALFMTLLEHDFNYYGVFPQNVTFGFGGQDVTGDTAQQQLKNMRAQERAIRLKSLEITPAVAQQLASDSGDLREEYLQMLGQVNGTPDIVLLSDGSSN